MKITQSRSVLVPAQHVFTVDPDQQDQLAALPFNIRCRPAVKKHSSYNGYILQAPAFDAQSNYYHTDLTAVEVQNLINKLQHEANAAATRTSKIRRLA